MTPQKPADRDNESTPGPRRKPYQKPRVELYGDLAEISKSVQTGGRMDGSGHPNKHFTT